MTLSNISLREFEFFRETVLAGSATRAADRLGVSQPAVSRALSRLEDRLAVELFSRHDGRLVPTAAAFALNEELEPVFSGLEKISQFSEKSTTSENQTLRIVAPPTFSICLMQPLIAAFVAAHPLARFQLEICSSSEGIQKIASGEADMGISNTHLTHEGVRLQNVLDVGGVCIMPQNHPYTAKSQITPDDLHAQPYVAMALSMSSRYTIDRIFEKAGVKPDIVAEVTTSYSACDFVSRGLGIALISPFPALDSHFSNLIARPFTPRVGYKVQLMTPSNPNTGWLAQTFKAFVLEQIGEQSHQIATRFDLPST